MFRTHDGAEAARLLETGGRLRRLAHDMAVDLTKAVIPEAPASPSGVTIEALDADAESIALAASAATVPGHVDFGIWAGVDRDEYWRRLLAGQGPCGPVIHAASRLLRDYAGTVVGAVVVTRMPAHDWWAVAPWIPEIFVVSGFQGRGLGGLLLAHAVRTCGEARSGRVGLTVTDGNPARHLYERFGFKDFRTTWLIERPG